MIGNIYNLIKEIKKLPCATVSDFQPPSCLSMVVLAPELDKSVALVLRKQWPVYCFGFSKLRYAAII